MKRTASLLVFTACIFVASSSPMAASGVDDILVNSDLRGGCEHNEPHVACDSAGNFVVVWKDNRNSGEDEDVFAQLYDDTGSRIGSNLQLTTAHSGRFGAGSDIDVAMDADGDFAVLYYTYDYQTSGYSLVLERFTSDGSSAGSPIVIEAGDYVNAPAIGMNDEGGAVAVWVSNNSVYGQVIDSDGSLVGSSVQLDDVGAEHTCIGVDLDASRNFVVVWDELYGEGVRARSFDASGAATGASNDVDVSSSQLGPRYPDVAMDASGGTLVTWTDMRDGDADIYAQWYDVSDTPIGGNFQVNDNTDDSDQSDPSVSMDNDGNAIIVWEDRRLGEEVVYAQRYNSSGVAVGDNVKIGDTDFLEDKACDVAVAQDSGYVIVWEAGDDIDRSDVFASILDFQSSKQDTDTILVNDTGDAHQGWPAVAAGEGGTYVVAWTDLRDDAFDAYAQLYSSDGTPVGGNFKVNDNDHRPYDSEPVSVGMNSLGAFVAAWIDTTNNAWDVCFQMYDFDGLAVGGNTYVDFADDQPDFAMAMNGSGRFAFVVGNGYNPTYVKAFDPDGNPVAGPTQLPCNPSYEYDVAMDAAGRFAVGWVNTVNMGYDSVWVQFFDASISPLGDSLLVNEDPCEGYSTEVAAAMNDAGDLVVAWATDNGVFAQRYLPSGAADGANITVSATIWNSGVSVAMNNDGSCVVAFETGSFATQDNRTCDTYYREFDSDGEPVGDITRLVSDEHEPQEDQEPHVAIADGRVYWAWEDYRRSKGADVYTKITLMESAVLCGDANASGSVDIDDIMYLINYIFTGGPEPEPYASGDVNCSGSIDIDDVMYLINYVFTGGPAPCDVDDDGGPEC